MTPEQAEEIFYQAKNVAYFKANEYQRSAIQREVEMEGWKAVIEAIRKEVESALVKEMMETGTFDCKSISDPPKL